MKARFWILFFVPVLLFGDVTLEMRNRPLARVGDRVVTLIDVVKKMDTFIHRNQMHLSLEEKFQFYRGNWRYVLDQLIDGELMLNVAKEREFKLSEGDVREELFRRYGSNMQQTLSQLNLTYEEAKTMLEQEMLIEQVQAYTVQTRALQSVTPQEVKNAYMAYLLSHPPKKVWTYQMATLQGADEEACKTYATKAAELATEAGSLANIESALPAPEGVKITLSSDVTVDDKEASEAYKSILQTLKTGSFSTPIAQFSRGSGKTVYRIFHLKECTDHAPPAFAAIAEKLKMQLLNARANKEAEDYSTQLRDKYHFIPLELPDDYEPFALLAMP